MKKLLIGLATGFLMGTGVCYYTQRPQQHEVPAPIAQVRCECNYTNINLYHPEKNNHENTQPENINLPDESLEQYGEQLYKEMYNGECIDLNKFLEAKEQISSIYREYGFEKAKTVYLSLSDRLFEFKGRTCNFNLDNRDLLLAAKTPFSLEDFMRIPYYSIHALTEYLRSQNKETRERYIRSLCENQEDTFLNPVKGSSNCREIASYFPEEVLKSTSIAQEVPEIQLTSEYLESVAAIDKRLRFDPSTDTQIDNATAAKLIAEKNNIGDEFFSKIANIVCERYNINSNPEKGIKGFVSLKEFERMAYSNLTLSVNLAYPDYGSAYINDESVLLNAVERQCGEKE